MKGSGFSLNFRTLQSLYSVWNPCVLATSFRMNSLLKNAIATISNILKKLASQYPHSNAGFLSSNPKAKATIKIEMISALISFFVKNLMVSPSLCVLLCFLRGLLQLLPLFSLKRRF